VEKSHEKLTKIINKWILKSQYEKIMGLDLKTGKFSNENVHKTLEEVKDQYGFYTEAEI